MKAKCNKLKVILGLYGCNLLPRFLNSCQSILHFYYYCRSHCNSVIGEVGLWRPRGLLRLKPLWRTLDPVREEWSWTPSLPSESLRTSNSAPPRQDESLPRSAHQNSSNVPYSERRRDHFSACPRQEQKRNIFKNELIYKQAQSDLGTANVAKCRVKLTSKKLGAAAEFLRPILHVSAGAVYGWTLRSQLQHLNSPLANHDKH